MQCKVYSLIVKCEGGGSTSGLHAHQGTKHGADLLKRSARITSAKTSMSDDQSVDGIKRKPGAAETASGAIIRDFKVKIAFITGGCYSRVLKLYFLRSHYHQNQNE